MTCQTYNNLFCLHFIGQFWNIPITAQVYNATADKYIITVHPPGEVSRHFIAERYKYTWDKLRRVCYYAGSGQGGCSGELASADDSVIEGRYTDYLVDGLYAHEFKYAQFEENRCA